MDQRQRVNQTMYRPQTIDSVLWYGPVQTVACRYITPLIVDKYSLTLKVKLFDPLTSLASLQLQAWPATVTPVRVTPYTYSDAVFASFGISLHQKEAVRVTVCLQLHFCLVLRVSL